MEADELMTNRGSFALRGSAGVLFGAVTLVMPWSPLDTLVLLFGAYVLLMGVCDIGAIVAGTRLHRMFDGGGWLVLNGTLSIGFGIITMLMPDVGALSV